MPKITSKRTAEREKTDKSLQDERKNADRAIAEKTAAVEADADRVLEIARDHADTVLQEARDKADDKLSSVTSNPATRAVIDAERKVEDCLVQNERALADENLLLEREQNARNLLALLPLERISTDRSLLTERVRSDTAVSHRDDFLGIVSHDLRDLLGGIVTTAAVLLRTAPVGETGATTRDGAERIQRYAARMKRLIEDLTDVVSIDAGKLAVLPQAGDLAPLISEAMAALRGAAATKNISIELAHPELSLPAVFDAERTLQVLTNVIGNAIKFTPLGGRISVVYQSSYDTAEVSVSDTGPGVAPELLEAIFERFRQVSRSERRGLGLGLYISRCLIEAQRGRIFATSTPGQGARLTFILPSR